MEPTSEIAVSNTPRREIMRSAYPSNNKKIEEAERELEELMKAQSEGRTPENEPESTKEVEQKTQEKPEQEETKAPETGWEKRYKDAQRYINKLNERIKALESGADTKQEMPATKEEMLEWMGKHPKIANIVKSIAMEQAEQKYGSIDEKLSKYEEMRMEAIIAKTEQSILKVHPDYTELKDDDDFHKWAEDLPTPMQDILYDTIDDPKGVIKIINLYKAENNIRNNATEERQAASSISRRSAKSDANTNKGNYDFTESEIERMSIEEYSKNADKIMEARKNGRIKFDKSAALR